MSASRSFSALGVECHLIATRDDVVSAAIHLAVDELHRLDGVASRFRPDSEVSNLALTTAAAGSPQVRVHASPLLISLLTDALWAANVTDGLVDPTLGRAMQALGYDVDFARVTLRNGDWTPAPPTPSVLSQLQINHVEQCITVPAGTLLDLGATAKAAAADRIAAALTRRLPGGFLVDLGGDIGVAGEFPGNGWVVAVADDHDEPSECISITTHGVATSGTDRRRWRAGEHQHHHLLNPATGLPVENTWRRVTCVAASALEANAASTAACVLGPAAPDWLSRRGIPARLVREDGSVVRTPGWPSPTLERAS